MPSRKEEKLYDKHFIASYTYNTMTHFEETSIHLQGLDDKTTLECGTPRRTLDRQAQAARARTCRNQDHGFF